MHTALVREDTVRGPDSAGVGVGGPETETQRLGGPAPACWAPPGSLCLPLGGAVQAGWAGPPALRSQTWETVDQRQEARLPAHCEALSHPQLLREATEATEYKAGLKAWTVWVPRRDRAGRRGVATVAVGGADGEEPQVEVGGDFPT